MNAVRNPSRRRFLRDGALVTGGLVLAFVVPGPGRYAAAQSQAAAGTVAGPFMPNAFLRIAADDRITVLLAHSEMGQGVWTSLPMLIAEELDVDLAAVRVEHAPAAPAYASPVFGIQGTGGSTSVSSEFERYRRAGAAARAMLVQAAAQRLDLPAAELRTEHGEVVAGDGRRLRYGELAEAAGELPVPDPAALTLKPSSDWRIIGKPTRRLDTPEKLTGQARFGIDVQFPGLLTAVVARAPVFGARLRSFDASAAEAVPGVRKVVEVPSGVAVVADHFWAARRGREALTLDWDLGEHAGLDSAALDARFIELLGQPGAVAAQAGDIDAVLPEGAIEVEAEYAVPYLAHAAMEPLNCTVRIEADRCELWLGTQFQTLDQNTAARITGLKPEQVEVHTTFLGGGFGRRANPSPDVVDEAVHVAKAAGAPVKTVWTREDDTRGGFYRPAFRHRAKVALGADGLPLCWRQTLVGQSILTGTPFEAMMVHDGIDHASVEGVADSPYLQAVANRRVELHSPSTGIPVLWWRSVGHSHSAFAMECLIDELALAAGQDPLAYRRLLLKDQPRHLGVLDLVASKAGWGEALPEGHARGLAVHASFGSVVAQIAEVSVRSAQIRVHRVVCAVDCGIAVNPDGVAAQIESAIVFGLSAALHGAVHFRDGRVQESNFHDYRVLRLDQMPKVEVHIVPSDAAPSGVGEPGTPPIAPAVANAVARLTGKRLRSLPLTLVS